MGLTPALAAAPGVAPAPAARLRRPGTEWATTFSPLPRRAATARLPHIGGFDFSPGDAGFMALCRAYRASGGLARQHDAAHCLAGRQQGDASSLSALIESGQVFSLEWQGHAWLPMFQLDLHQHARRAGGHRVLAELRPVFDGWALAGWLVRGNAWLAGQRPLDQLATRLPAVLAAARADRFVANG